MTAGDAIARLRELHGEAVAEAWAVTSPHPVVRLDQWVEINDGAVATEVHRLHAAVIVGAVNALPALLDCAEALAEFDEVDDPSLYRTLRMQRRARAALERLEKETP